MRGADGLCEEQNNRCETSYPACPAQSICLSCWLHQIIASRYYARLQAQSNLSAFIAPVKSAWGGPPWNATRQASCRYFQPKKSCAQMKWPTPAARAAAASTSWSPIIVEPAMSTP